MYIYFSLLSRKQRCAAFFFSLDVPFFSGNPFLKSKPHHATKQKKRKTFSGIFGPRTFFKNNVFWLLFLVFGFPRCFCFWLRELLSATRTAQNQKTSRKPLKKMKNIQIKTRIVRNVWAKFFFVFGLPRFFLILAPEAFIGY